MAQRIATVFGGSGFIGRYVVKRLAAQGYLVRVAVRDPVAAGFLKPMGDVGQIVPLAAPVSQPAMIARAVERADAVINLVGILAEAKKGDFQRIQAEGSAHIARAAAAAGVTKFVQLSAIGADPASPSAYGRTKAEAETAVRAALPQASILRPSIVFGREDQFFNRFAAMAALSPALPVIEGATLFQPVYVGDVADAVMAALTRPDAQGRTFELGGPDIRSFRDLLVYILEQVQRRRMLVRVPRAVASIQAAILQNLPGKLLTKDQLLLLQRDNIVSPDALSLLSLGLTPTPIDLIVPAYLARYRPGGGRKES
jgi:NADH dehydrogenase